jgi:hypothetical protein
MTELSKQRTDLSQTFEDFERVMEDYFRIIPPDIDFFKIDIANRWEYDDLGKCIKFYFDDDWYLQEFLDKMRDCPGKHFYMFEEYEHVDRKNLIVTVACKIGGLY